MTPFNRQNKPYNQDFYGRPLKVGQTVIRACKLWKWYLSESVVTKVEDFKVFLDNSKRPVNFPGRLLIVDKPD